jgi:hypothetical protein
MNRIFKLLPPRFLKDIDRPFLNIVQFIGGNLSGVRFKTFFQTTIQHHHHHTYIHTDCWAQRPEDRPLVPAILERMKNFSERNEMPSSPKTENRDVAQQTPKAGDYYEERDSA